MKQCPFIIAVMIVSVATISTDAASALKHSSTSQMIDIYVRRDEKVPPSLAEPLILVGTFNLINSITGQEVTIQVDDQRTNAINDTRTGRTESDRVLIANLLCPILSEVRIN